MPDAMEPFGQHMDEEPADEFICGKGHGFVTLGPLDAIIFVFEGYAFYIGLNQAAIGNRNAVGVAGKIGKHSLWPPERFFGIDYPFYLA